MSDKIAREIAVKLLTTAPLPAVDNIAAALRAAEARGYAKAREQAAKIVQDQADKAKQYTALNEAAKSIRDMEPET